MTNPNVWNTWNGTIGATLAQSWREFATQFPTESDCIEDLFQLAVSLDLVYCHHCGGINIERRYGAREFRCESCSQKSWFTSKTFFARMKRPIAWLGTLWLIEHKVDFNAKQLEKLAGIAYATASEIVQKIMAVLRSEMESNAPSVSSSLFKAVIYKRSRETPARAHPYAEQEEIDQEVQQESGPKNQHEDVDVDVNLDDEGKIRAAESEQSKVSTSSLDASDGSHFSPEERAVIEHLSNEPIPFDILCQQTGVASGLMMATLTLLQINGIAAAMPGNEYARALPAEPTFKGTKRSGCTPTSEFHADYKMHYKGSWELAPMFDSGTNAELEPPASQGVGPLLFIKSNFHGISRKYLQHYLALYWCKFDRARWQAGALLKTCFRSPPLRRKDILEFISPAFVKILPRVSPMAADPAMTNPSMADSAIMPAWTTSICT